MKRATVLRLLMTCALPLALGLRALAFRFPETTEGWYGEGAYPWVVAMFGSINRVNFSVAEVLGLLLVAAGIIWSVYQVRASGRREPRSWRKRVLLGLELLWSGSGLLLLAFVTLWGLNYARPKLETRLAMPSIEIDLEEVLAAGRKAARQADALHASLDRPSSGDVPTALPFDFAALDRAVDQSYARLRLPGDRVRGRTTPAKKLWASDIFSYLGISGIFIPFTGEPSVNALVPDASLPMVLAHEKAHQRGITHEGEASFAAFLACAHPDAPQYMRYAAFLFATRYLLGEASVDTPEAMREELAKAWMLLGAGPRRDLQALADFWRQYEGPVSETASRVNDGYLKSQGIDEGTRSYGTVVKLLVAADRRGELATRP